MLIERNSIWRDSISRNKDFISSFLLIKYIFLTYIEHYYYLLTFLLPTNQHDNYLLMYITTTYLHYNLLTLLSIQLLLKLLPVYNYLLILLLPTNITSTYLSYLFSYCKCHLLSRSKLQQYRSSLDSETADFTSRSDFFPGLWKRSIFLWFKICWTFAKSNCSSR